MFFRSANTRPLHALSIGVLLLAGALTDPLMGQETDSRFPVVSRISDSGPPVPPLTGSEADHNPSLSPRLGPPSSTVHRSSDGTTTVTVVWHSKTETGMERRSTQLTIANSPEPGPLFLGACAGCVFLLHRRRTSSSRLQPARASNLNHLTSARIRRARQAATRADRRTLQQEIPNGLRPPPNRSSHGRYGRLLHRTLSIETAPSSE